MSEPLPLGIDDGTPIERIDPTPGTRSVTDRTWRVFVERSATVLDPAPERARPSRHPARP